MELALILLRLVSESVGVDATLLENIGCAQGLVVKGHYYPPCPEPELTFGTADHTDNDFLTIILQDEHGGLQVLHKDEWVDVSPLPGALVINLGDMLQASFAFIITLQYSLVFGEITQFFLLKKKKKGTVVKEILTNNKIKNESNRDITNKKRIEIEVESI